MKDSHFRLLFESAPGLYLVLDPTLKIVAVSNSYLNATMTKRPSILNRNIFDVFPDNPDDPNATGVQNLHASLNRVLKYKLQDDMAVQKYDIRRPQDEGGGFEERYWSPINTPVLDDQGNIIYIIHRVEDITDFMHLKQSRIDQQKITEELRRETGKKEAEIYLRVQEIQKMNHELSLARDVLQKELATGQKDLLVLATELASRRQELQNTIEEMRIAKDEALRASKVKSQFLANMSHEIRTPLGIILGFTELLQDSNLNQLEREKFTDRIRHSGQHLLSLLSEILDLTKIEAGHIDVDYAEVVISEFLQEIFSVLKPLAHAKNLELNSQLNPNLPVYFKTDPTKLRQIVLNLVSNAIKFCEHGKIEVQIFVEESTEPKEIYFIVKDCGPGIASNYLSHLFEEFSQADTSMTRTHGGSGLGLALSRKLARAMDGDVELIDTAAHGTTFRIRLPLHPPNLSANPSGANVVSLNTKRSGDLPDLEGVHLLYVDDSPENLDLIRHLLKKSGAQISTAAHGEEGVEKALAGTYDLILMDIQMPKLNGYDATSLLRSKGYKKPIIAFTAHAMKDDQEKCLNSGCDDYLSKPVDATKLIHTIHKNLGSAKQIASLNKSH